MALNDGSADFERIRRQLKRRLNALPRQLGNAVLESIRDGSPITGAPGQPEQTGELKRSWKMTLSGNRLRVFSNLFWAEFIEEGFRQRNPTAKSLLGRIFKSVGIGVKRTNLTLRSPKGGFHSVKITRANIQKLVDKVVEGANVDTQTVINRGRPIGEHGPLGTHGVVDG